MKTMFYMVILVLALVVVSAMSKADNDGEQTAYCEGVRDKIHPDYKNTFKKSCSVVDTE